MPARATKCFWDFKIVIPSEVRNLLFACEKSVGFTSRPTNRSSYLPAGAYDVERSCAGTELNFTISAPNPIRPSAYASFFTWTTLAVQCVSSV